MKLDLPDDYLPLIIKALDHYHAYTVAKQSTDSRYKIVAEWFEAVQRKGPWREERQDRPAKKKRP